VYSTARDETSRRARAHSADADASVWMRSGSPGSRERHPTRPRLPRDDAAGGRKDEMPVVCRMRLVSMRNGPAESSFLTAPRNRAAIRGVPAVMRHDPFSVSGRCRNWNLKFCLRRRRPRHRAPDLGPILASEAERKEPKRTPRVNLGSCAPLIVSRPVYISAAPRYPLKARRSRDLVQSRRRCRANGSRRTTRTQSAARRGPG